MVRQPPGGDPYMIELVSEINAEFLQRDPVLLGSRMEHTTWYVRFRAPFSVGWVQVHVQSTEAGEGGENYDPNNSRSSTEVDCRADRVQEITVTGLLEDHHYTVWLVPVQYDGAGTKILYDGEGSRPDNKSYVDRELTGNRLTQLLSDQATGQDSVATLIDPIERTVTDDATAQDAVTPALT